MMARLAVAIGALILCSGCVVLPQAREVYDPQCRTVTRQVVLEVTAVGGAHGCAGDGCLALLTAAGAVTVASAVISGSIALIGNAVYWMERQGRCPAPVTGPAPPPPAQPVPTPTQRPRPDSRRDATVAS